MSTQDIRWIQRFRYFTLALAQLKKAVDLAKQRALSDLEKQGLMHTFEYTHELAWNTIKDYFEYQGETNIHGSRDACRLAFRRGLIENGETWMDMIKSRTLTAHTYNESVAEKISSDIIDCYYSEMIKLRNKFESLSEAKR